MERDISADPRFTSSPATQAISFSSVYVDRPSISPSVSSFSSPSLFHVGQHVPLGMRDAPAPDVLLGDVTRHAEIVDDGHQNLRLPYPVYL
jgi:hypothetical protein